MTVFIRALAFGVVVLSACAGVAHLPDRSVEADELQNVDPFVLGIEAGRWNVLVDRAGEGLLLADYPEENEVQRIDGSLKAGALAVVALRLDICRKGLGGPEDCEHASWPEWITQPPSSQVSLKVLQERSEWLGDQVSHYSAIGCRVGRLESDDELFCSVE